MPAQPLVCGGDEMTDWGEGPRRSTRQTGSNRSAATDLPIRCGRPCEDFASRAGP